MCSHAVWMNKPEEAAGKIQHPHKIKSDWNHFNVRLVWSTPQITLWPISTWGKKKSWLWWLELCSLKWLRHSQVTVITYNHCQSLMSQKLYLHILQLGSQIITATEAGNLKAITVPHTHLCHEVYLFTSSFFQNVDIVKWISGVCVRSISRLGAPRFLKVNVFTSRARKCIQRKYHWEVRRINWDPVVAW